jgi:dipeptidyl-peptidase-4
MRRLERLLAFTPLLFLLMPASCPRADTNANPVTRANYELAGRFTANNLLSMVTDITVRPVWLDGGSRFWYAIREGTAYRFFIVDAEEKTRSEVSVDLEIVGPTLVEFNIAGRTYRFDTVTREITRIYPDRPPYEVWETPSPDGNVFAFASHNDLAIRAADGGGAGRRLTQDGEPYYTFAEPRSPFYSGENAALADSLRSAEVLWSPDSKKLVAIRTDVRGFRDNWVINSLGPDGPEVIDFKQRFPGDRPPVTQVFLYDRTRDSLFEIKADKWSPTIYQHVVWGHDSDRFYMVRKPPDHLRAELLEVEAATGRVKVLLAEDIGALALTKPVVPLKSEDGFLWWSRRDGYGHYYLYDYSGVLKRQVTSGDFSVAAAQGVDRESGMLFFTANGRERRRNPYYDHLYSVKLSGGDVRPLTYEDAHHEVYVSPSYDYFVDNYSRVDEPPKATLRDAAGDPVMELEAADISYLKGSGWRAPEVFKVKAADGETDLWGVMYKPYDFDPARKYPIISFVYPGPQDELVPLTFMDALSNNAHLAQFGFIVVHAGNRGGSFKRSVEYSEHYRGNLRDYPVADNRAVVEELATRYGYIDIDRVGIWGGSSGAYAALTGMLTYPEFYKVCVARSGPHDPSIYHAWWSDQFQGMTTTVDAEGTVRWLTEAAEGNLSLARNLKGRLLLVHSEADRNVHPAHSARMARALMAAGKRFDYFMVPGASHAWGPNWAYVQHMIWTYFVRHLMGDARWDVDIFQTFDE